MLDIDKSLSKDQRILLAAEDVFSRKGYTQSTLDEIIKLADTGKGTVYKYFGSKDNLFYTLICKKNEPFIHELEAQCFAYQDIESRLKVYLRIMISFLQDNCTLWQVLFYEMSGANRGWHVLHDENGITRVIVTWGAEPTQEEKEQVQKYFDIIYSSIRVLEQIIADGVKDGVLKPVKSERIPSRHLYGGVAMSIFHSTERQENAEELAKLITDRFLYGQAYAK